MPDKVTMTARTYDKNCKACRLISKVSTTIDEAIVLFVCIHYLGYKGIVAFILIQPIVLLAVYIVRKTLPMAHHMFDGDKL